MTHIDHGSARSEPTYDPRTLHAAKALEEVLADPTLGEWPRYKISSSLDRVLRAQQAGIHYIFRISYAADRREGICTCGLIVSLKEEPDDQALYEAVGHLDAGSTPVTNFIVQVHHFGSSSTYSALCQPCGHVSSDHPTLAVARDSLGAHQRDCCAPRPHPTEETP